MARPHASCRIAQERLEPRVYLSEAIRPTGANPSRGRRWFKVDLTLSQRRPDMAAICAIAVVHCVVFARQQPQAVTGASTRWVFDPRPSLRVHVRSTPSATSRGLTRASTGLHQVRPQYFEEKIRDRHRQVNDCSAAAQLYGRHADSPRPSLPAPSLSSGGDQPCGALVHGYADAVS
jgi:hypothetical protein